MQLPSGRLRGLVALSSILFAALPSGCVEDDPFQPADESNRLLPGVAATGELEPGGRHSYVVPLAAETPYRASVRAREGSEGNLVGVQVRPIGAPASVAGVNLNRPFPFWARTPWFAAEADDFYVLQVENTGLREVSYELDLHATPVSAEVGDTVSGFLLQYGERRFALEVPEAVWAVGHMINTEIPLSIRAADNSVISVARHTWSNGPSRVHSTDRFELESGGDYDVSISGRNEFEFIIEPINTPPEVTDAAVALGSTFTEPIDAWGDVDEFELKGSAGQEVLVRASPSLPGAGALTAELMYDGDPLVDGGFFGPGVARYTLPATGAYTLRVASVLDAGAPMAPAEYGVELRAIDRSPEAVGQRLPFGELHPCERVDGYADVDDYTFELNEAGRVRIAFFGTGFSSEDRFRFRLSNEAGDQISEWGPDRVTRAAIFDEMLPAGAFRFVVEGESPSSSAAGDGCTGGSYQLALFTIDPAPETAPASVEPNVTITGESVDYFGDIDSFTIAAEPGHSVVFLLRALDDQTPRVRGAITAGWMFPFCCPADGWEFRPAPDITGAPAYGPFRVPADGVVRLDVSMGQFPDLKPRPYEFQVVLIDRQPETRDARISFGELVTGESLTPYGDVDEFLLEMDDGEPYTIVGRVLPGSSLGVWMIVDGGARLFPPDGEWLTINSFARESGVGPSDRTVTVTTADPGSNHVEYEFTIHKTRLSTESSSTFIPGQAP